MKNCKNIFTLTAAAALLLGGCSDDTFFDGPGISDPEKGAVIYVPDVTSIVKRTAATRSEGTPTDVDPKEKDFHRLRLFAYPMKEVTTGKWEVDNTKDLITYELNSSTEGVTLIDNAPEGYQGYQLDIEDGHYRMYVVANVDFGTTVGSITVDDLEDYPAVPPTTAKELENNGLPMSCANSELQVRYEGEQTYKNVYDDTGIDVKSGKGVKVQADLKFAVAKVRVTLLNDIMPAKTVDESKTLVKSVPVSDSKPVSNLFAPSTKTLTNGNHGFCKSKYYQWGNTELKDDLLDVTVDGLNNEQTNPASADCWIWQGTVYVGERLFESTATDKPTIEIAFTDNDTKTLTLGEANDAGSKANLKRSYFYDYVGTPMGEFRLKVQPWSAETIMGALHGAFYLHVDKTHIDELKSGEPQAIWYDANATLDFEFPEVKNSKGNIVKLYTKKISNDTIYLSVNSLLGSLDQAAVDAADKSYNIIAGTIRKKMTVGKVELTEYLNPDKETDEINVRTIVESGNYSGYLDVTVNTNLEKFTVEKVGDEWTTAGSALTLTTGEVTVPESGEAKVRLNYSGLNTNSYWNDVHTVSFNIKGSVNGAPTTYRVDVSVLPSVDDYTIYLYAPDWKNPHIYVYQCLKLPSTNSKYANGAVCDGGDDAALEYSFTGGAAFRGWNVIGVDGVNHNNPMEGVQRRGTTKFYEFAGANNKTAGDWNISEKDKMDAPFSNNYKWEKHYYNIDFCAKHRAEHGCSTCKDLDAVGYDDGKKKDILKSRLWPGIRMEDVSDEMGENWWKFTLSGLAKPGQALIMFTDMTENDHSTQGSRYPDGGQPGLPLFDFPNKVGYFRVDKTGDGFVNTKPNVSTYKYEIRGNMWDGSNWKSIDMSDPDEDGIWTLSNQTIKGGNFGIGRHKVNESCDGDNHTWYASDGSNEKKAIIGTNNAKEGSDDNWSISAGTYDFEFNPKTKVLKITGTAGGGGTKSIKYYIRGNIWQGGNNWTEEELKLENGKYVLKDKEVQAGNFYVYLECTENGNTWYEHHKFSSTNLNQANKFQNNNGSEWTLSAGKYSFSLDAEKSELTVTGGSTPTPSDETVRIYVYDTEDWNDNMRVWVGSENANKSLSRDNSSSIIPLYYIDVPKNETVYIKKKADDQTGQITITPNSTIYINNTDNVTGKITLPSTISGQRLVYFKNNGNWSAIRAHVWPVNGTGTSWPGDEVQTLKGKYYYYYVKNSDYNRIIFNNGSGGNGNQTGDCNITVNRIYDKDSKDYN